MRHFASPSFWEAYAKLPQDIQALADKNYALLKDNPRHPSLQLKKVERFWSVRVGARYRALAVEIDADVLHDRGLAPSVGLSRMRGIGLVASAGRGSRRSCG